MGGLSFVFVFHVVAFDIKVANYGYNSGSFYNKVVRNNTYLVFVQLSFYWTYFRVPEFLLANIASNSNGESITQHPLKAEMVLLNDWYKMALNVVSTASSQHFLPSKIKLFNLVWKIKLVSTLAQYI